MEYKSNLDSVILDLKNRLKKASDISKLQRTIASDLLSSNLIRIHNEGRTVDGGKIGQYNSNHPLYINPKNSPKKFKPKGRYGATVFKSGKKKGQEHKTKFFPSYAAFRGNIGRQHNYVNLQLSGKLRLSFVAEQTGKNWIIGFNSKYGAEISTGQEEKWGKRIWGISEKDKKNIHVITEQFINNVLTK